MVGPAAPPPDERIFISYRRSDSQGSTSLLRRGLEDHLGPIVFQDVSGIEIGEHIPDELEEQLRRCDVVLAVIGPDWLTVANQYGQRRIDLEDDWVRRELSYALADGDTPVIPVLVNEAELPPAEALPEPLRGLVDPRAIELYDDMWEQSVEVLANRLRDLLDLPPPDGDAASEDADGGTVDGGVAVDGDEDTGSADGDAAFEVVTLRFGSGSDGAYPVALAPSRGSEPAATAPARLDTDDLRRRLAESTAPVDGPVRRAADTDTGTGTGDGGGPLGLDPASLPTLAAAREIGADLHAGLAPTTLWDAYRRTQSAAGFRHANGVRIVVDATDAPDLAQLPWELLFDPVDEGFVVLDPMTPVIRTLDVRQPPVLDPVVAPLRLLVAAAQPPGMPELAIGEELANLDRALRPVSDEGALEIKRLEPVTVDGLMRELDDFEPHIVHFIGHGGLDDGDGHILIEDDDRTARRLTGDQLGVLLNSFEEAQPRLVFLNSCLGAAQSTTGPPRDSFGGMAQTLLRRGVPAVIAMQFPIPDASAVGLAEWFYRRLARGRPVEVALSAGRSLLYARDDSVVDWAAPALYKRSPETPLFHLDRSNAPRQPTAATDAGRGVSIRPTGPVPTPPSTPPSEPFSFGSGGGGWFESSRRIVLLGVVAAVLLFAVLTVTQPSSDDDSDAPPSTATTTDVDESAGTGTSSGGATVTTRDTTTEPSGPTTSNPTTSTPTTETPTTQTTTPDGTDGTDDGFEVDEASLAFESGSTELTPEAIDTLDELAAELARDPELVVTVQGYTDAAGPADANRALSQARADAAVAYLTEQGVDPARLDAVGRGEQAATASPEDGRRVDFAVGPVERHEVVAGDTLWALAETYAGSGDRWPELFEANADVIDDPDLILVGQILRIPPFD